MKILCPFIGVVGAYAGTRCTYGNLCDSDHRTFSSCTSWKMEAKGVCRYEAPVGRSICPACEEQREKRRQAEEKTEPNDSSRRSDHKVSGVSFATTLQAQESEVPKETTAKKRKKNSSEKIRICGN